jgi:hypothetical protein
MKQSPPKYRTGFIYTSYPGPHKVAWYKWEFLRRNPEYHADYNKFLDTFGPWFEKRCYWYDEETRAATWTKADEDYFYAKIFPTISRLCHKWRIGNLFPPDWRFNRKTGLRRVAGDREMFPPTSIAPELNWDLHHMSDLIEMGFTGTADSAHQYGNLVRIEFNLNWPMKDLVKYAKYVLGRAMENYKDELKEAGLKIPKSRRRFEDYDLHLTVWDLREKGKSPTEIVGLVPGVHNIQNVQDHLKAARNMISGGYSEIR